MDISDEIQFQHDVQRRMFGLLDALDPGDTETLGALWAKLAGFLEVHAAAEERHVYPELLKLGAGSPTGDDDVVEETKDAIKDHNEIRDAIAESARHEVGSPGWWSAIRAAREANDDHMAEEERDDLADFRRNVDLQARHDIAVRFLADEARNLGRTVPAKADQGDKDPDEFVAENS